MTGAVLQPGEYDAEDVGGFMELDDDWFDDIDDGFEYEPYCDLENPETCESCQ